MTDFAARRARMVERQLRARGIDDERVLAAMGAVPREAFVPPRAGAAAPTPTRLSRSARSRRSPSPGSSPRSARRWSWTGSERVLEVGTGSGYSTARPRRSSPPRWSASSATRRSRAARPRGPRLARRRQRRAARRRRQRRPPRAGPASTRSPSTPPPRRRRRRWSPSSPTAAGMVVPIASDSVDVLTVLRRRGEEIESDDARPLPLRAADRRGGLRG